MNGNEDSNEKRSFGEKIKADLLKKQHAQLQQMKEAFGKNRKPPVNPPSLGNLQQNFQSSSVNAIVSNSLQSSSFNIPMRPLMTRPPQSPITTPHFVPEKGQSFARPQFFNARPAPPHFSQNQSPSISRPPHSAGKLHSLMK